MPTIPPAQKMVGTLRFAHPTQPIAGTFTFG